MAKVTSKLQVTIPKVVADDYGIAPGDEIDFVPAGDAIRVHLRAGPATTDRAARLARFDEATERQRARQASKRSPESMPSDRGWQREDLYDRGRAG